MHTEFEQKTPIPFMFSHVYKVPKEINKWIVKIIIKKPAILEYADKRNSYLC